MDKTIKIPTVVFFALVVLFSISSLLVVNKTNEIYNLKKENTALIKKNKTCLHSIQTAREIFGIAGESVGQALTILDAYDTNNFFALEDASSEMDKLIVQLEQKSSDFNSSAKDCGEDKEDLDKKLL